MQPEHQQRKNQSRQEKIQTCQSQIDNILERLAKQLDQGYSEDMKQYLKAMASFHQYSIYNLFLIMSQKSHATRVAGFQTWKKLDRKIMKGEKGLRILAPILTNQHQESDVEEDKNENQNEILHGFKTVYVFDISQTTGPDIPQPTTAQGNSAPYIPALEQAIQTHNIQLQYDNTGNAQGISQQGKITINPNLQPAETFSTLAHEFAHHLLHIKHPDPKANRSELELEADAAACVVCEHFGLQALQASSDYIQMWKGDKKSLITKMDRIRKCASKIIQAIENHAPPAKHTHSPSIQTTASSPTQ